MRTADSRRGAVLVVIVLMTLALLGLSHGLMVSAEGAYLASRARARVVELDAWVAGVMEEEVGRGWRPWMDSTAVGERRVETHDPVGVPSTTVVWRRSSPESWLLEVEAASASGGPVGRRRLIWLYDPGTRVASLPAVVTVGPEAPVALSGSVVADAAPSLGVVSEPVLGLLPLFRVLAAADPVGALGTPAPVEAAGSCDMEAPWNWGDPGGAHAPCGLYFPIKGRVGPMVVDGGRGQGILVADGDVTFRDGALFRGLVLASGRVDVSDGSVVEGRILAFGGIVVGPDATVVGSPGGAETALAAARARLAAAVSLHPAARLGPE